MAPSVSDQIIAVIDQLCEKFGIAIDWSSETVIPYLEDLVYRFAMYKMISTLLIYSILFVVLGLIAFFAYKYIKKKGKNFKPEYETLDFINQLVFFISIIVLSITGISFIIGGIPDIVSANVFPERLMINYIMNLIEGT